jgi:hypothetical protein
LRVAVVERAGALRDDAEQHSAGIAHDPPSVHKLHSFGAESFQPGDLGVQIVGVDVQVQPARTVAQPLDEQPELLAVERDAVIFGVTFSLRQRLTDGGAPERQLAVMLGGRDIDHDLGQPAVVSHPANLRGLAAGPGAVSLVAFRRTSRARRRRAAGRDAAAWLGRQQYRG